MTDRLTRGRLVEAALAILDQDGLDALTMRALGREVGADPMAAYHYFPSKEALFDAIVEAVWQQLELPPAIGSWQQQLRGLGLAVRAVLRSHPNALPVLATRQSLSEAGFAALDRGIAILRQAGLDRGEALAFLSAASALLIGGALAAVGRPPHGADDVAPEAFVAAVNQPSARRRFPDLAAALASTGGRPPTMDEVFETGMAALLQGLTARLRDRA